MKDGLKATLDGPTDAAASVIFEVKEVFETNR